MSPVRTAAARLAAGWRRRAPVFLRRVALLAIALHFGLIMIEVTYLRRWLEPFSFGRAFGLATNYYSTLTFANRRWGFFAPEVSPDWNLHITVKRRDGSSQVVDLPRPTREMEIKTYAMASHFADTDDSMDLFARSWALYVLRRDPLAVRAELSVSRNLVPTMAEFRAGKRVQPVSFYRTEYAR